VGEGFVGRVFRAVGAVGVVTVDFPKDLLSSMFKGPKIMLLPGIIIVGKVSKRANLIDDGNDCIAPKGAETGLSLRFACLTAKRDFAEVL
jgi:hypothetical protein